MHKIIPIRRSASIGYAGHIRRGICIYQAKVSAMMATTLIFRVFKAQNRSA